MPDRFAVNQYLAADVRLGRAVKSGQSVIAGRALQCLFANKVVLVFIDKATQPRLIRVGVGCEI